MAHMASLCQILARLWILTTIRMLAEAAVPGSDMFLEPFDLGDVQLAPETFQARSAALNAEYLLVLPADRLLWSFRKNAGLPTPGEPFGGSWEDPYCDLRGHFVGHYLSALAFVVMSSGDQQARERLEHMVNELEKVQGALKLGGYLSAFPAELFDRLEALKGVWAPYYTIHKIMAGLLDAYQLAGQKQALGMVVKMADYFLQRIDTVIKAKGHDHWLAVLNVEFGGMNDVLYRLHRVTRDAGHLRLATLFDKPTFLEPLVHGRDVLEGLHANTHLAQVVGFAERYETTGDKDALAAVQFFFGALVNNHSYATGGSNAKEFWFPVDKLADSIVKSSLALETQETCTQYNILKIARSLFRWTANPGLADFYERGLLNGILGVQRMPTADVYGPQMHYRAHAADDGHHHHHHMLEGRMKARDDVLPHESFMTERHKGDEIVAAPPPSGVILGESGLHAPGHVVPPRRRPFNENYQPYWGFDIGQMPHREMAVNSPGTPGVFLYLLPLGAGQSKLDNLHHWGYPFHSFWCCYGTAVEAFAKLADSIYFRDRGNKPGSSSSAPRLYINQLVSSTLTWRELGIKLRMSASLYAEGPAAAMVLEFMEAPAAGVPLTIMMRIPQWAVHDTVQLIVAHEADAQEWAQCPGHPTPSSFCQVDRTWHKGSRLLLQTSMAYAMKPLPDPRPEYAGLHAIMMGPFVMAGLTHDTRRLVLPGGTNANLSALITEPPNDWEELLSLSTSWNGSQYVRHDQYHLYLSVIEDSGDAIDATFRLLHGCPVPDSPSSGSTTSAASRSLLRSLLQQHDSFSQTEQADQNSQHHQMRVGLHEHVVVAFESVNQPGFYLGWGSDGVLVLDQHPRPGAGAEKHAAFCNSHTFSLLPGLDGRDGTISLEALHDTGRFVTSAPAPGGSAAECEDIGPHDMCAGLRGAGEPKAGLCSTAPGAVRALCRKTCDACSALQGALTLQRKPEDGSQYNDWSVASSFRVNKPLAPRYPPGAKVITGINRRYLVAPLGNLVDERYTAYFDVHDSLSSVE